MDYKEAYKAKLGTLDGALASLRKGDVIATPCYGCFPFHFVRNLHKAAKQCSPFTLWAIKDMGENRILDDEYAEDVSFICTFYDEIVRNLHQKNRVSMLPVYLHNGGERTVQCCKPTVFVSAVSPMDENGNFHMSLDLQLTPEQLENADRVILEVNKNLPITVGDTAIPFERADYFYEAESPLSNAPKMPTNPTDTAIAEQVASLINDGDCLQLGIGGVPNAVGAALMHKHDLGVHTEMITSSMGQLMKAGVITNARKNYNTGKTIGCFAWGDQELYDYIANNPNVVLHPASYTNRPEIIAMNDNMVSVNAIMQMDLTGQICSESIGPKQFSGAGGAFDFAFGATHSKGGKSIIATASTAKNGTISKISAVLPLGSVVTIPRNVTDYVVTEYGIARLTGKTIRQRVDALIAIAHPDFRAELRRDANKYMLW